MRGRGAGPRGGGSHASVSGLVGRAGARDPRSTTAMSARAHAPSDAPGGDKEEGVTACFVGEQLELLEPLGARNQKGRVDAARLLPRGKSGDGGPDTAGRLQGPLVRRVLDARGHGWTPLSTSRCGEDWRRTR